MLNHIVIKNYRNITSLNTKVLEGGNLIIAPNGSGKTNALESIYYSVLGESFKPMETNSEVIGPTQEFAKVSTKWDSDSLDVTISNNQKLIRNFQLNTKKTIISKISPRFPIILFAPHTVDLVIGEPQIRRSDLNAFLSILNPEYKKILSKYTTVLKNRNAVIKQIREGKVPEKMLEFWTEKLIEDGTEIYNYRLDFFTQIKSFFLDAQMVLFGLENFTLDIEYIPNISPTEFDFKTTITQKFVNNKSKEIIVGKTLYGIHKDDYTILLNNQNLKFKGSRGQQRIGISVLKFAELLLYFKKFGVYPLLLLDDIMSELDDVNRSKIAGYLLEKKLQFILTSAEQKEVPAILRNNCNIIDLSLAE